MRRALLLVLLLTLAGCGAAPAAEPTSAAAATRAPVTREALEAAILQDGDLPAGLERSQMSDAPPKMFDEVPAAAIAVHQQFQRDGGPAGGATLLYYEDVASALAAYDVILVGMGDGVQPLDGVGDQGQVTESSADEVAITGRVFADLVFQRCGAVVHVRFSGAGAPEVTAYARRVDRRLEPLVCR